MRKLVIVIALLLLVFLLRPKGMWGELKQSWEQRNRILRVLVIMVVVYLVYGFFKIYQSDMFPFW